MEVDPEGVSKVNRFSEVRGAIDKIGFHPRSHTLTHGLVLRHILFSSYVN